MTADPLPGEHVDNTRLVSVITIFLNAERFLREAIESVLAQTHDQWELVLVDDGSTDGSAAIARDIASHHPDRIIYIDHPGHANRGMSASRNLGVRHSRGAFIAFLDADDVWLDRKLERQVELLLEQPAADMVYGPSQLWFSWTGNPEDRLRDNWRTPGIRTERLYRPPELLEAFVRGRARTPATCAALMRRRLIDSVGGFENRFRGLYEDQAFFAKVFATAPVFVSSESWDRYRQHRDSYCFVATDHEKYHPDLPHPAHHDFLLWLEGHLDTLSLAEGGTRNAIKRKLLLYRHPLLHLLVCRLQILPDRVMSWLWERVVPRVFQIGRLVLPKPLRQWIWDHWFDRRFEAR